MAGQRSTPSPDSRASEIEVNLIQYMRVCVTSEPCLHSGVSEIEGRLPCCRLLVLCRNEAVLKWMSSCDHLMYQALVEILIPDVLRPIPSEWLSYTVTHTHFLTHP